MDGPLELRTLLLLVSTSLVFTTLAPAIYRHDPGRRKLCLASAAVVLLLAPWWSVAGLWTWPIGVEPGSLAALAQPVPWLAVALWWAAGAALMTRTVARVAAGRRRLDSLPDLADPATAAACERIARTLGISRPVGLKQGPSPCASSLGNLVLVLPATAHGWPERTRTAVLSHELAHLKRLDDRVMLLVRLLTDWYWWMPWLKSVHRRYVEAMEESCDDLASSLLASREDYVGGLVDAARSITGVGRATAPANHWPAWVALLGHSHLAARVQRLLTVPRPTWRQADGRWVLLWTSLAFVIVLTARPAAIPHVLPRSAQLFPIIPAARVDATDHLPGYRIPRIETASFVQDHRSGVWRPLPASARLPLPVYPARALEHGLQGKVTVELTLRPTTTGVSVTRPPILISSDPDGILTAAVERALARNGGAGLDAGLRTVSAHNNDIHPPPPGARLRLRTTYSFVLDAGTQRLSEGVPGP